MNGKRIALRVAVAAIVVTAVLLVAAAAVAAAPELLRIRHSSSPQRTRIVLDCSGETHYRIRRVSRPERIVVDLGAASSRRSKPVVLGDGRVQRVRINDLGKRIQVVLDLDARLPFRDFALAASGHKGPRIVIDVMPAASTEAEAPAVKGKTPAPARHSSPAPAEKGATGAKKGKSGTGKAGPGAAVKGKTPAPAQDETPSPGTRSPVGRGSASLHAPGAGHPYVIVIDPGHGGRDPGTRGCGVIREKDLVLGIARAMARELRERTNFKVVLTRDRDRYVDLHRRVEIARRSEGDLFVSIHANSARSRSAHGVEVYFLSPRGATDQAAAELANRENAAHMVGMESASDADDVMMSILMDLQSSGILRRSGQFAELTLLELSGVDKVQARFIKQARFAVLRTLSMPSILVEVGYLSNRSEARYLKKASTQRKIGRALAEAVMAYCERYGEKGRPQIARQRRHRVRRGDTLWDLARLYGTSVSAISRVNHLDGNRIRVGQELILP